MRAASLLLAAGVALLPAVSAAAPTPPAPATPPATSLAPLPPLARQSPLPALRIPGPLSPRAASYVLSARLDEAAHTLTATERLTFRNTVGGVASAIVLHLYLDAFRNQDTIFLKESHGGHRTADFHEGGYSEVQVTSITVAADPSAVTTATAPATADLLAAAHREGTLLTVPLPHPVAQGESVALDIAFTVRLPKVFARSGYAGAFTMGAQWFPKAAVWQCDAAATTCAFHADEYHADSEFFADWGTYDVTLDVPQADEVAGCGVRVSDERRGDRRVVRYHAEDIHDFAFAVDPRFRVYEDTVPDAWGGVRVLLYLEPGHESMAPRHLAAAHLALDELQRRFGVFPYSQATIVDVPDDAEDAGGMEYPTLVTTDSFPVPDGVRAPEFVTVHELGHQFFYGIVGSDEAHEPWLDEGLNETFSVLAMERGHGAGGSLYRLLGHAMAMMDVERSIAAGSRGWAPIVSPSWGAFPGGSTYSGVIYAQTTVTMRTVEGLLGAERFERGWRSYVDRYRFRHPTTDDFIAAFDAGAGEDLRWFWEPALRSTAALDYEVASIVSRDVWAARGRYDCPRAGALPPYCQEADRGKVVEADQKAAAGEARESDVLVHRVGDLVFPVTLAVHFSDGTEAREAWDGRERFHRFTYRRGVDVAWAEVDPERRVALDLDGINDGLRAKPDARASRRLGSTWAFLLLSLWQLL